MATSASNAATAELEGSLRYPGWRVVAAAYSGVMVSFASLLVFTFSIFVKPLAGEFGWSREAVSGAFALAALSVALCSPVLGAWLDRYSPRRIILPCMAIFGLGILSLAFLTPHLAHLYAIFTLMGVVGNGTTQMGYSRAVCTWFDKRRGFALALVVAGVGTGSMVLPPLAQAVIDATGWRTAYLVLGTLVLIFGLPLTAVWVRERPGHKAEARAGGEGASVSQALRAPVFWIIIATLVLNSISINGAVAHLVAMLTDRGVSTEIAAFAASVLGGASLAGRLVTGSLLDRFFGPRVAFVLFVGSAAGILLLSGAASAFPGMAAAALIGFGMGAEANLTPYLLTRYFGLRSFSTLYGLTWTAYAIAGAAGPVFMGRFFDRTGSYTSLLVVLSGAALAAALLMLAAPRYPAPESAN
ncbi:MAG TPA: MFS transporter [Bryobacteraceae bacterium]|nr:MFS transporter [Bryobacteraceae bacterium]